MSIIKVCTQLRVLHLSNVKIYESQRQRSAAFSLTLSPLTHPLTLSIFPLWSFPLRSARPSWWRGTGQPLSVCVTRLISACVCVSHMCVITPALKNRRESTGEIGLEVSDWSKTWANGGEEDWSGGRRSPLKILASSSVCVCVCISGVFSMYCRPWAQITKDAWWESGKTLETCNKLDYPEEEGIKCSTAMMTYSHLNMQFWINGFTRQWFLESPSELKFTYYFYLSKLQLCKL